MKDTLWLRNLLTDLGFAQVKPTPVFIDNRAAIIVLKEERITKKTKHLGVRIAFVRDQVSLKTLWICGLCHLRINLLTF